MRYAMALLLLLPGLARAKPDLSDPEVFKSYVDGSLQRQGGPADPAAPKAGAAAAPAAIKPIGPAQRLDFLAVPDSAGEARRLPEKRAPERDDAVAGMGLALSFATACLLLAWQSNKLAPAPWGPPPPLYPARPERWQATPPPPQEPYYVETADSFIDTRMPARTWRAITLAEQRLIERWNASPEKAHGDASFQKWLAMNPHPGVDAELLKEKLARRA